MVVPDLLGYGGKGHEGELKLAAGCIKVLRVPQWRDRSNGSSVSITASCLHRICGGSGSKWH
jgi:hypothetical protein